MNILIYCGYQSPWESVNPMEVNLGGSEKAIMEVFHGLRNYGHAVMLVGQGINLFHEDCREFQYFASEFRDSHWDLVIGVNYANYLLQLDEIGITFNKSVFWLHNEEPFDWHKGEQLENPTDIFYNDRVDTVVCVSGLARDTLASKHPEVDHKMTDIINGLNLSNIHPVVDKTPNSFIYSSCPSRGLWELLDLWPAIAAQYHNAELHICYPAYSQVAFEDISPKLDAISAIVGMDSIQVHGSLPQDKLYALMAKSEYWLYPVNYFETFCITATEMLAHGVKAISTDTSGNVVELLNPPHSDQRGLIIPYSDTIDELSTRAIAAIDFLQANPDLAESRTQAGLDYVSGIGWDNVCSDWNELCGALCGEVGEWDPIDPEFYDSYTQGKIDVDAVYVIGLERTVDWTDVEERLTKLNLPEGVDVHFMTATDGRNLTPKIVADDGYNMFPWKMDVGTTENVWWLRDMTMGEIGCAISHHSVWMHAIDKGYSKALFLEEDFRVNEEPYNAFDWNRVPKDNEMFFLGRNAFGGDDTLDIGNGVCVPFWSYNAHAYTLTDTALQTISDSAFDQNLMPVDEFLGAFWMLNPPREDILRVAARKIVTHAISQSSTDIVGQTSVTGLNSTTEGNGGDKLHPELYTYWTDTESWVKRFIAPGTLFKEWDLMVDHPIPGVLEMPLFTKEFCEMIREEAEHANSWTTDRHEFYPTTDMLLQAIDMHDIYMDVLRTFVMPMTQYIWGLDGEGWDDLHSENFLARYIPSAQGHLSLHHDNSDITALVNLSNPETEFVGGGTYFKSASAVHRGNQGHVTVHPGRITHKHGARPITEGSRYIVVSFMTNRALR